MGAPPQEEEGNSAVRADGLGFIARTFGGRGP